jgi:O-antigen/teichoic acid export membrane protein
VGNKRILGRNAAWNVAGLSVEIVAAFLVMPFLIARLGQATYGVWIVLGALTSYFGLLDLGIRSSIGRHVALHHASGDRAAVNRTVTGGLVFLALVGLIAMGVVFACESLFFRFFDVAPENLADARLALRIVTLQFALFLLATGFDLTLWGLQRFDLLNAVDIPAVVLRAGLTFTLVRSEQDLVTLAAITLGVTTTSGVAKVALCFRADPGLRIGFRHLSRSSLRELLGFGSWSLIANLARITRRQLGPLLIGSLLGLSLVAPFAVADRLLQTVAATLGAVTGVLTPFATALHATEQTDRQRRLFVVGGRYSGAFAAFLIGFLLVLGRPLITLWIGSTLADTALLLTILALGELLPNTQYVTNGILVASARHRSLAAFGLLEAGAVCLLMVALIPPLGLIGVGLAIAVPAFLGRGVAPAIQGCRVVGVPVRRYLAEAIVPPVLCAAVPAGIVGLAAYAYPPATWTLLIGYGFAYAGIFAGCYAALTGRTRLWRLLAIRRGLGERSEVVVKQAGPGSLEGNLVGCHVVSGAGHGC